MNPIRLAVLTTVLASALCAQGNRTTSTSWRSHSQHANATDATAHRQEPATDSVNGTFGVDFATAYFFRGIRQENQGLIAQPHLELDYTLTDGTPREGVQSLDLVFGTWNSVHSGPTGASGDGKHGSWYESDFYLGLTSTLLERWHANAIYTWYTSPNGIAASVEELSFGLAFDDSGSYGEAFPGLQPSAVIAFETDGQADGGSSKGTYGQIGIAPAFALGQTGDFDWHLSIPVALGFSLDSYYEHPNTGRDRPLGFLDLGVAVETPMPFVPSRFGPWTMDVSLHLLWLGDATDAMNGNDDLEWIFGVGFTTAL